MIAGAPDIDSPFRDLVEDIAVRLSPFGAAVIDLFEATVRASADVQTAVARTTAFEPAQYVLSATAELTRDIGAAYASCARWILDA